MLSFSTYEELRQLGIWSGYGGSSLYWQRTPISSSKFTNYSDVRDSGLDGSIFQKRDAAGRLTNEWVIFLDGSGGAGIEDQLDNKFSQNPMLADQIPVTVFQVVKYYKWLEENHPGAKITLAGHSMGAGIAKLAGTILQNEGKNVEVAAFSGWGLSYLLDNLGMTPEADKIVNFYNVFDATSLPLGGIVYNFGSVFYARPMDYYNNLGHKSDPWNIEVTGAP